MGKMAIDKIEEILYSWCARENFSVEDIRLVAEQIDMVYNPLESESHFLVKDLKTGKVLYCTDKLENKSEATYIKIEREECSICGGKN